MLGSALFKCSLAVFSLGLAVLLPAAGAEETSVNAAPVSGTVAENPYLFSTAS